MSHLGIYSETLSTLALMMSRLITNKYVNLVSTVRGHPFMTSTQRGQVDEGRRVSSMWTSSEKIELTEVILSSSHAKKLAFLY